MVRFVVLAIFVAFSAVHLVASWRGNARLVASSKPLLMPALAAYYLVSATVTGIAINWYIVFGLLLGLAGDVLLLKPEDGRRFLGGLAAFLVGHILYIVAFAVSFGSRAPTPWAAFVAVPLGLYAFWYLRLVGDSLGDKKGAVIAYMVVIVAMAFVAMLRAGALRSAGAWIVFAGSISFMASDSLLGYETFRARVKHGRVIVMTTYVAAQLCIAQGFLA